MRKGGMEGELWRREGGRDGRTEGRRVGGTKRGKEVRRE